MRIAFANWTSRRVGGAERYIELVIDELWAAGHDISLWAEGASPELRDFILLPDGVQCAVLNTNRFRELERWRPDVIYVHGLRDPDVERHLLALAPSVFFAHNYYGTCISGDKTQRRPVISACERRFGWQCMLCYFPKGCGGKNPIRMIELYRTQHQRLGTLGLYDAVLTPGRHMQDEYLRNGIAAHMVALFTRPPTVIPPRKPRQNSCLKLIFVGRMDALKGGDVLLEALPLASAALDRPLLLTFVGDGPVRKEWNAAAARLSATASRVTVRFTGWVSSDQLSHLYAENDLLVVPSLWPEPFGMVGLEAGWHRLPAVGFAVGGIQDWLTDGSNGVLAENPPRAAGLADAIVRCARDPEALDRFGQAALDRSSQFSAASHLDALLAVFRSVTSKSQALAE